MLCNLFCKECLYYWLAKSSTWQEFCILWQEFLSPTKDCTFTNQEFLGTKQNVRKAGSWAFAILNRTCIFLPQIPRTKQLTRTHWMVTFMRKNNCLLFEMIWSNCSRNWRCPYTLLPHQIRVLYEVCRNTRGRCLMCKASNGRNVWFHLLKNIHNQHIKTKTFWNGNFSGNITLREIDMSKSEAG